MEVNMPCDLYQYLIWNNFKLSNSIQILFNLVSLVNVNREPKCQ